MKYPPWFYRLLGFHDGGLIADDPKRRDEIFARLSRPVLFNRTPPAPPAMTPLEMIEEWRKGCSNAGPAYLAMFPACEPCSPAECVDCTEGLIDALTRALGGEVPQGNRGQHRAKPEGTAGTTSTGEGKRGPTPIERTDPMSDNLAHTRAHEAEARHWLDHSVEPIGSPSVPDDMFTREVVFDAFEAGWGQAEAACAATHRAEQDDWAVERATGQRQLDAASALLREAAERFREYEDHHDAKISNFRGRNTIPADVEAFKELVAKRDRNGEIAKRIEDWLRGDGLRPDPVEPSDEVQRVVQQAAAAYGAATSEAEGQEAVARIVEAYGNRRAAGRAPVEPVAYDMEEPSITRPIATSADVMRAGGVDPDAPFEPGHFPADMRQRAPDKFGNVENFGSDRFIAGGDPGEAGAAIARATGNVRPIRTGPLAEPGAADAVIAKMDELLGGQPVEPMHPVDALKLLAAEAGMVLDPDAEAHWRSICDELVAFDVADAMAAGQTFEEYLGRASSDAKVRAAAEGTEALRARHRPEGVQDLDAPRIVTGDPRFTPGEPVNINGYLYHPAPTTED